MKFGQAFKMSLRSIGAKRGRTFLTMLGIIIGVASVVILVSVVQGSNKKTMEYYERLGSNKITVSIFAPGGRDVRRLLYGHCARQGKLIEGVTPQGYVGGPIVSKLRNTDQMEKGTPSISFGNEQFSICNHFQIARGRDICSLDIKNFNNVIVLGAAVADYLFNSADPVGQTVSVSGHPFTVVGVYKAKDPNSEYSMDNMAVVPESANRILNQNEPITEFVVKARSASATKRAAASIAAFLESAVGQGNSSVYSENQSMEDSSKQNEMMSMVLGGIAGISLLVGGIGIMNIMLVTVSERTREIGIRKALGAPRAAILLQFLVESSVVCGAGGSLGILLGMLGSLIAGKLILNTILFPSLSLAGGAFLFSVTLGIAFGMYPAAKASALTPVEALRAE